jgi:hypothetical protein
LIRNKLLATAHGATGPTCLYSKAPSEGPTIHETVVMAIATFCEVNASFKTFALLVCPLVALSVGMIGVSLRSLTTLEAHKLNSVGSVLGVLDVLMNAVQVTVPLYRTFLFNFMMNDEDAAMTGDPTPEVWLLSSFVHWLAFAFIITCLLVSVGVDKNVTKDREKKTI